MRPALSSRHVVGEDATTERLKCVFLVNFFERNMIMQTELLNVTGMTCGGCTSTVTQALKEVSGVADVDVSLSSGEVTVQYDERLTSPDQLKSAVKGAGYGVGEANAAHSHHAKGGCC